MSDMITEISKKIIHGFRRKLLIPTNHVSSKAIPPMTNNVTISIPFIWIKNEIQSFTVQIMAEFCFQQFLQCSVDFRFFQHLRLKLLDNFTIAKIKFL